MSEVAIDVHGLEVRGFHGALPEEKEHGQRFLFDVRLEVAEPAKDRVEATADYREIVAAVREVSDAQAYRLLESGHELVVIARNPDKTPSLSAHPRVQRVAATLHDALRPTTTATASAIHFTPGYTTAANQSTS